MKKENNVKIGISHGSMFLKILIVHFVIQIGLNIICLLISLPLHKFEFVDNFITYTGILNQILSLILAIKFISKKYILKEDADGFIKKIVKPFKIQLMK